MRETNVQKICTCPSCGGEMIQKSKVNLISIGILFVASFLALVFFIRVLFAPGLILGTTGIYLLVWATFGKASWCRNCKKFSVRHY